MPSPNRFSTLDKLPTLIQAVCTRNIALVIECLRQGSSPLDALPRNGLTALHYACELGHFEIFKLLVGALQESASQVVSSVKSLRQSSLLHSATIGLSNGTNTWDVIEFLLQEKVDPRSCDKDGCTPRDHLLDGTYCTDAELHQYDSLVRKHCGLVRVLSKE